MKKRYLNMKGMGGNLVGFITLIDIKLEEH